MGFKGALRARLLANVVVSGLIGERIHWGKRPQGEPFDGITLTIVSDPRPQHLKGFDALRETRVQIDCWSRTDKGATDLAEAAIAALVPENTSNGIIFNRASIDAVRDRGEFTRDTQLTEFIHRASIDLRVWWQSE